MIDVAMVYIDVTGPHPNHLSGFCFIIPRSLVVRLTVRCSISRLSAQGLMMASRHCGCYTLLPCLSALQFSTRYLYRSTYTQECSSLIVPSFIPLIVYN